MNFKPGQRVRLLGLMQSSDTPLEVFGRQGVIEQAGKFRGTGGDYYPYLVKVDGRIGRVCCYGHELAPATPLKQFERAEQTT